MSGNIPARETTVNSRRIPFARLLLLALLSAASVLWGCGDELPPGPGRPKGGDTGDDGIRIVFTDATGEGKTSSERAVIKVMNPDGSGQTIVGKGAVVGPAGANRFVFWRDDSVFVATWRDGAWTSRKIWSTDRDPGIGVRRAWASAAVSPDGGLVTFSTTQDWIGDDSYIRTYLGPADGSSVGSPLPVAVASGCTPVFSRDSRRMAFYGVPVDSANTIRDPASVYVLDTRSRTYTVAARIKGAGFDGGTWLDFSPDGSKIVYTDIGDGKAIVMYVANSDGTGTPRRLAESANYPVWSSDGKKIVYIGSVAGGSEIMMRNADGSGSPVKLTNTVGQIELDPQYSPYDHRLLCTVFPGEPEMFPGVIKVIDMNNLSSAVTLGSDVGKGFWLRVDR